MTFKKYKLISEILLAESRDYSCVMLRVDPDSEVGQKILNFIQTIPDDIIYKPDDEKYGKETEPHVTILYGLHSSDPGELISPLRTLNPIRFNLMKTSFFDNEDSPYKVLKVDVDSPQLHDANEKIKSLDYTNDYPTYHPHLTLAYIKRDKGGEEFEDLDILENEEGMSDQLSISTKTGKKFKYKLKE